MFYEPIEVIKRIDDLTIERFKFYLMDGFKIVVDEYVIEKRKSTRCKKYTVCNKYSRLNEGVRTLNSLRRDQWLKKEEVPLTEDIKKQVIDMIMKELNFD